MPKHPTPMQGVHRYLENRYGVRVHTYVGLTVFITIFAMIVGALYVGARASGWWTLPILAFSALVGFATFRACLFFERFLVTRGAFDVQEKEDSEEPEAEPKQTQEPEPLPSPQEEPEEEAEPEPPPDEVEIGTDPDGKPHTISRELRNRHLYVIGKPRQGKTTLLENIMADDMQKGHGVAFIDPSGDAIKNLLALVPSNRTSDVLFFDPASKHCPPFNPLALPFDPPKLTTDLISVFQLLFGASWGNRMGHILRYSFLTLIADEQPRCLRDVKRLLTDDDFRNSIIDSITDDDIREYWEKDFAKEPDIAVHPILNKLSDLLLPQSHLLRIFSNTENALNFTDILDNKKILIASLASGSIGDEPARLLGGMLVTGIYQAALARAEQEYRPDFYLFVDEFHQFAISSFGRMYADTAKYRLNLTLAHHNVAQLQRELIGEIYGSVGTMISYCVDADSAQRLGKEMGYAKIMCIDPRHQDYGSVDRFIDYAYAHLFNARDHFQWKVDQAEEDEAQAQANLKKNPDHYSYAGYHHLDRHDSEGPHIQLERVNAQLDALKRPDLTAEILRKINKVKFYYYDLQGKAKDGKILPYKAKRAMEEDYTFISTHYPDVKDFQDLPRFQAIMKQERSSNVYHLNANPPLPPDPYVRTAILTAHEERYPLEEKGKPEAQVIAIQSRKDVEDFHY